MFRSLKSFYFFNGKEFNFTDDYIISDIIETIENINFKLLTYSDNIGYEELIELEKDLHEIYNGRSVIISLNKILDSDFNNEYYYALSYDEFIEKFLPCML